MAVLPAFSSAELVSAHNLSAIPATGTFGTVECGGGKELTGESNSAHPPPHTPDFEILCSDFPVYVLKGN